MTRFIFITGGVVSSLGKGIAAASLAALLKAHGYRVRLRKLDPYLNVDPGTMSPFQHGEVFVTDDGAETDLDLGHYERYTDVPARRGDNITSGRIYSEVIARERRGDYLGATIQVIPHVTDAIKEFITSDTGDTDFLLCEIGGTVGDIESLPFLEAIRQLRNTLGSARTLFVHLTLLPYLPSAGELKTKPTQHSVKELLSVGIQPDMLLCRTEQPIDADARRKIALFCNLAPESVISAEDVDTIYRVPLALHDQGFDTQVLKLFGLPVDREPDLSAWRTLVHRLHHPAGNVTVGVVGKYTRMVDSYKSIAEALTHGGLANNVSVTVRWLDASLFEENPDSLARLQEVDAILVPGGFGKRGTDGKIETIRLARERHIPFLGICFGMQMAVVEVARHLAALPEADSTELNEHTPHPLVGVLTEWRKGNSVEIRTSGNDLGGTMRLGAYECTLAEGSRVRAIYGQERISERHRHRYEVNSQYREILEGAGLKFSGMSPDGLLPEIVELEGHPWFIGVQFHPELKSRPHQPHPLFADFIRAALERRKKSHA